MNTSSDIRNKMIMNSPDSQGGKAETVMPDVSDFFVSMGKMVSLSDDISVSKAKTVIISSNTTVSMGK